jgi:hypothetical protein
MAAKKVAKDAATKAGTDAAVKSASAAASGGTGASVVQGAIKAGAAAGEGDAMGVAEEAVKGAAVAAASAYATPVAGAVVNAALNTDTGRKLTRATIAIAVFSLFIPILFVGTASISATGIITSLLASGGRAASCVDPLGGGVPVTNPVKQQEAKNIVIVAYQRGYGRAGAQIALMAALTESQLDVNAVNVLEPASTLKPSRAVGVYQRSPWAWANEVWPAGTSEGSAAYSNNVYLNPAIAKMRDSTYVTNKFFDRLEANPDLADGKWKTKPQWEVAAAVMESNVALGENYALEAGTTKSTVITILQRYPTEIPNYTPPAKTSATAAPVRPGFPAPQPAPGTPASPSNPGTTPPANPGAPAPEPIDPIEQAAVDCGSFGTYGGWGSFALPPDMVNEFKDGPSKYGARANIAVSRALSFVGHAERACRDGKCYRLCDHLAADIWGYTDASGYRTAKEHWFSAVQQGVAHPGDTNPPIGALLFWDTGPWGHVATYIGNGYAVSNLSSGPNGANVYKVPASLFSDSWGAPYYGWADPTFPWGVPRGGVF